MTTTVSVTRLFAFAAFLATRFSRACKRFSTVAKSGLDIVRNLHDINWDSR